MPRQPVLFVSHGAPTLALDPGKVGLAWQAIGHQLERPDAIVVVSAHWETTHLAVTHARHPGMIYDFYGFPDALYRLQYAPPGAPELAEEIVRLAGDYELECSLDESRGLDHGAWVPLMHLFPQADIPVIQLSLLHTGDTHRHHRVGEMLAGLRDRNILIVTSGSLTHNLRYFGQAAIDGPIMPFVDTFRRWAHHKLKENDQGALLGIAHAPEVGRNHPSAEHLTPLLVALGAAGPDCEVELVDLGVQYGMLAMDTVIFR